VFNSGILADPGDGATYDHAPAPPGVLARARRTRCGLSWAPFYMIAKDH
jgi:hypothetical protein